jgi:hypothetical protein
MKNFLPNIKTINISILIVSYIFILSSNKVFAQMPVSIEYVNPDALTPTKITEVTPQVRFWVTNFESTTSSSTLFTKDETLVDIANKLLIEEKRHNQWLEDFTKKGSQANKELARGLANKTLLQTNEKIMDFMKKGFNKDKGSEEGNPAYVENQQDFLAKSDVTEVGVMVKYDFESDEICEDVKEEVKKVIGKESIRPELKKQIKCTLKDKGGSPENIKTWEDFLSFSKLENNPMGALVISKEELTTRQEEKEKAITNELNQGKGSLSYKRCREYSADGKPSGEEFYGDAIYAQDIPEDTKTTEISEDDAGGYKKVICKIVKPGSIIDSSLQGQQNSAIEMNQIDATLGDSVNRVDSKMSEYYLKKLEEELKVGIFTKEDKSKSLTDELYPFLSKDMQEMEAVQTSLVNPFDPKDIYDPQNTDSPYNPKKTNSGSWFDYISKSFQSIFDGTWYLFDFPKYTPPAPAAPVGPYIQNLPTN